MKQHKECKGCFTNGSFGCVLDSPFYMFEGKKVICPCVICIVKVMCFQGCDQYTNYVEELDEREIFLNNTNIGNSKLFNNYIYKIDVAVEKIKEGKQT